MTEKIPKWALRTTLLFSLPISAGALYLTRTYGIDNLAALNLDAGTIFVRRLSIDVLLAAHVAAFFIIAMLPDSVFKFRRWQLRILALAIWAFDGTMIFQARLGIMQGADNVQVSAAARVVDQRSAIKGLQESAAAMRSTAARQMANKMITAGALSQKEAARLEAKAAEMSEKLASMPSGSGVTEIKTVGWFAPYKAAIESALVSFVSLIMLGLAGLSARMLLDARERPALMPVVKAAPAAPVPAPQPPKVSYSIKALRGLGILTAGSAAAVTTPVAHSAPVMPAKPAAPSPAPACTPTDADALAAAAAPASAPVRVHPPAPERMQKVQKKAAEVQAATLAKRTPKIAAPAPDARPKELLLTEVLVGAIRAGDKNGGCKPSQRSIRDYLKCNQDNADWYLAGLYKLNVIEPNPNGRGWKVKA